MGDCRFAPQFGKPHCRLPLGRRPLGRRPLCRLPLCRRPAFGFACCATPVNRLGFATSIGAP